ncbi:signal peptidase I [Vibrio sp. M260112]|uniref:signal peptidase I n=1 Tax=Vibrio sp. M260112 TaxID=3020895 RepID=UPI002F3EB74D
MHLLLQALLNLLSLGTYDAIQGRVSSYIWSIFYFLLFILSFFVYFESVLVLMLAIGVFLLMLIAIFISSFVKIKTANIRACTIVPFITSVALLISSPSKIELLVSEGNSMSPLIKDGDTLLLRKINNHEELNANDIIGFKIGVENEILLKRIIATQGDSILYKGKKLYINDSFILIDNQAIENETIAFKVPKDSYYVLGDNLNESFDSRYFKDTFVKKSELLYKYIGTIDL